MRLGACLLTIATPDDPLACSAIPLIKKAGYDYAEVSLARLLQLSEEEIENYREQFSKNSLPVEVFNNAIPSRLPMIGPDRDEAILQSYIEKAVSLAERMGVSVIAMCGPIREWVPADFSWDVGFGQYVAFMQMYADAAAARGISLSIEPINHEEEGFIATVEQAKQVIEACGRSNISVTVDFYHFFKENDDWEALLKNCSTIVSHAHYAAQARRSYPLAADEAECRRVLTPFVQAGYQGRLSVEAHTTCPDKDLPETCKLLRTILG